MVFTESQLGTNNVFGILDDAIYLNENESIRRIQTIPIKENSTLDCNIVDFSDIIGLCEDYGIDYEGAINLLAEVNSIPSCLIAVAIPEDILIESPELVDNLPQVVAIPMSSSDPIGDLVNHAAEACLEQGEESFDNLSNLILTEGRMTKIGAALMGGAIAARAATPYMYSNLMSDVKKAGGKYGGELGQWKVGSTFNRLANIENINHLSPHVRNLGMGLIAVDQLSDLYRKYKDRPKSTIAKAIASLRNVYAKWMNKANSTNDKGIAATLKRGAAKVLQVIDKLLHAMQRATN